MFKTCDAALADLVRRGLIDVSVAKQRSSDPAALERLLLNCQIPDKAVSVEEDRRSQAGLAK